MSIATCPSCLRPFDPIAGWQRVCKSCYAKRKQTGRENIANLRRTLEADENQRLKAEVEKWKSRALAAELYRPTPIKAGIPPDQLRRLMLLCNPDRHGGSEAAHTATAWLLAQRPQKEIHN